MIRWPIRKPRFKSAEYNTRDLNENREPKKSILRTKYDENGPQRNTTGFYETSSSMINLRGGSDLSPLPHNQSNWDSVSSDFVGSRTYLADRNPRGKRNVLFVDQLVTNRQPSVGSNSSSTRTAQNILTGSDRSANGHDSFTYTRDPSAFFSYPASYQSSPNLDRRERNISNIELVSRSPIVVRKESLDMDANDSISSRSALRPSIQWFKKKTKKTTHFDSGQAERFTNPTTTTDAISVSSTNIRCGDKPSHDERSTARPPQYVNKTVPQSFYNTASKPPLPPLRDTSSSPLVLPEQSRVQNTRVNENRQLYQPAQILGNSTFQHYPVEFTPNAHRTRAPNNNKNQFSFNKEVKVFPNGQTQLATRSQDKMLHPHNERTSIITTAPTDYSRSPSSSVCDSLATIFIPNPVSEGSLKSSASSNTPIPHNRKPEIIKTNNLSPNGTPRSDRRLRRRVTLAYAPETSIARNEDKHFRGLPNSVSSTGRIIEIRPR